MMGSIDSGIFLKNILLHSQLMMHDIILMMYPSVCACMDNRIQVMKEISMQVFHSAEQSMLAN